MVVNKQIDRAFPPIENVRLWVQRKEKTSSYSTIYLSGHIFWTPDYKIYRDEVCQYISNPELRLSTQCHRYSIFSYEIGIQFRAGLRSILINSVVPTDTTLTLHSWHVRLVYHRFQKTKYHQILHHFLV